MACLQAAYARLLSAPEYTANQVLFPFPTCADDPTANFSAIGN